MSKYGKRVWNISAVEQKFEQRLAASGFVVLGLKEYKTGFTDYLIEKDGISVEYRLYRDTTSKISGLMSVVSSIWTLKKTVLELEQENCKPTTIC